MPLHFRFSHGQVLGGFHTETTLNPFDSYPND